MRLSGFDYSRPMFYMVTLKRLPGRQALSAIVEPGRCETNPTTRAFVNCIRTFHLGCAAIVALTVFAATSALADKLITSRDELAAIAGDLAGTYALGADIHLEGADWTPLGDSSVPFTGTFHGNGHRITGLRIDRSQDYSGLFGVVSDAVLDGVTLDAVSITAQGGRYTGALAGDVRGATTISNCAVGGDITEAGNYAGLLVGRVCGAGTTFADCVASGTVATVTSEKADVGGLVGGVWNAPASFENCESAVNVESPAGSDKGGFVGSVRDGDASAAFTDCRAFGDIRAANSSHVGGFIGYTYRPVGCSNCVATGRVSGRGAAGGLVGYCGGGTLVLRDSVSTAEAIGADSTGGFIGGVYGGGLDVSGCRADGFVSGGGRVGGFVGSVGGGGTVTISNCAARGDVRSTSSGYGGFVGDLNNSAATNVACWSSGAVWGTAGDIGAFVGKCTKGTNVNCSVYGAANGPRTFCGSNIDIPGGILDADDVKRLSVGAKGDPWPKVRSRAETATPISTAEELLAVTNDLAGCYMLVEDIDLGGGDWTPLGDQNTAFSGEFYGRKHLISNFEVETTNRYAGFFGHIHGGRVSGVRLEGSVSSAYTGNSLDAGVGGFAGKIQSKSMVDGCLFKGEVGTESSYNAGGFAGRTDDSPMILRCGADATVANASENQYAGGFIGYHNGGFVKDSYAVGDVYGNTGVGGFAGYLGASPRIAASWCSVGIGSEGGWTGAFVGYANGMGLVTNAYYDTSRNDDYLKAQGKQYSSGSDDYFGISAVNDIQNTNGFPALDFENTWFIDPIEQHPCLQALQFSAYEHWLDYNAGLPWYLEPDAIVNGIPAGVRYVFGIDPDIGPADFPGPLLDIGFDANGMPCVKLPPLANTEGATVEVLSAGDLSDWSGAVANPVDPATGVCVPDLGDPLPDRAFFRYRIRIGED